MNSFALAFTATEAEPEAFPLGPVQLSVYVALPGPDGAMDTLPLVGSTPDQPLTFGVAEAAQEVTLALVQVNVTACP